MRFGTNILHLDNDIMTRDGTTTIPETLLQQLKALRILWLVDNPIWANVLDAIQLEVFALARQLNDAMDECCNNEMSEKTIMQIGR